MKIFYTLLIGILCTYVSYGQSRYIPNRIENEIQFDGLLNEPVWQQAKPITNFMQYDPVACVAPSQKTEVRMIYNNEYLYFGFKCYDNQTDKIIAQSMERDFTLGNDDGVAVVLDTYNDKSTGVVFISNLTGARFDEEFSNDGGNENTDYNTYWDYKFHIDSDGYTLEYQIPFSSLRFEAKDTTVMGFKFVRLIKRLNEFDIYPICEKTVNDAYFKVSLADEIEFANLKSKRPVYITPYVIANYDYETFLNDDGSAYESSATFFNRKYYSENETLDKIISNIGVDFKYGITKNFTLDATLNTDFAQAEVDNRIVNLTKYEINLPEKRSFFLESQNYLNYSVGFETQLFNSREIGNENDVVVPIVGGLRVTGKQNGWAIGLLNMQTTEVKAENITPQNFTVARFRKTYDNLGSFFGGFFSNRVSTTGHDYSNQSYAIDMVHHFNKEWFGGFGWASTYDSTVNNTFDKNNFYNIFLFKQVREGWFHSFDFEYAGKKFFPAVGFNPETDYGFVSIENGRNNKITNGTQLNYINIGSTLQYRWKLESGLTETRFANIYANVIWEKGEEINITPIEYKEDRLYDDWQINDHITIPANFYNMTSYEINFNTGQLNSINAMCDFRYGDFYGGKLFKVAPELILIANRYFRFDIAYEYDRIKFPDEWSDDSNGVYINHVVNGSFTVTLSSKFSIKLLSQYDNQTKQTGSNLRIRYNPKEGTDLYVVFNQNMNTHTNRMEPNLPALDSQAITIKFSKTFGL